MNEPFNLKEISQDRIAILGKLKNNEVDLSKHELVTKKKAEYLGNEVLGDVFRENISAFLK
jgi:hypothetical protein